MKKLLISGVISASLLAATFVPSFADSTTVTQSSTTEQPVVTAPVEPAPATQTVLGTASSSTPVVTTNTDQGKTQVDEQKEVEKDEAQKDEVKNNEAIPNVVKDLDPKVVQDLRAKGFGYGQIAIIAKVSKETGKSIDDVVKLLQQDKGFGKVLKSLNKKLGKINSKAIKSASNRSGLAKHTGKRK